MLYINYFFFRIQEYGWSQFLIKSNQLMILLYLSWKFFLFKSKTYVIHNETHL